MIVVDQGFDETGMLLREDGGFVLRRIPVDYVNKRIRVIGTVIAKDLVDSEGVAGI